MLARKAGGRFRQPEAADIGTKVNAAMREIENHNQQLTNLQPNELLVGCRPLHLLRLRPNSLPTWSCRRGGVKEMMEQ